MTNEKRRKKAEIRRDIVLQMVLAGKMTKEIAIELGTSPKNIERDRGQLLKLYGARNVQDLVRKTYVPTNV